MILHASREGTDIVPMTEILHDVIYHNPRNHGTLVVYMKSCRIYHQLSHSTTVSNHTSTSETIWSRRNSALGTQSLASGFCCYNELLEGRRSKGYGSDLCTNGSGLSPSLSLSLFLFFYRHICISVYMYL